MSVRPFGRLDGQDVAEASLGRPGGLALRAVGWGAALRELTVPLPAGGGRSVVLGLPSLDDYVHQTGNFGAVVGRYANRIGGASFPLDGRTVELVPNEGGNQLHGGPCGFGRRVWSLLSASDEAARFGLVSENGEMGWPGRLVAVASYELPAPLTLRIVLEAFVDRPCPVNLASHLYFNFDGSADARGQVLSVSADAVTPVGPDGVPTGAVRPVEGTRFDFRTPRPVGDGGLLDINYVLARAGAPDGALAFAARLEGGGIALEIWTSEPGLQVYDGAKLDGATPDGRFGRFAGIALEPQRFPDAPNHPGFPSGLVQPGTVSRQVTEFRFGRAGKG